MADGRTRATGAWKLPEDVERRNVGRVEVGEAQGRNDGLGKPKSIDQDMGLGSAGDTRIGN